jgi:hypothetical protein
MMQSVFLVMTPSWQRCSKRSGHDPEPADVEDGLDQAGNFHLIGVFRYRRPFADVRINPSVIEVFAPYAYSAICAHLQASA